MQRHGKPVLGVVVWGDWSSIISARDYLDVLIEQKPYDEDGAQYKEYRIECANTAEMVKAYQAFMPLASRVALSMEFQSEDKAVQFYAQSDDGYGSDGASCNVNIKDEENEYTDAMDKAIVILKHGRQRRLT